MVRSAVSTPGATAGVATEVVLAEVASASEAVTLTRTGWPSWAAVGVNCAWWRR